MTLIATFPTSKGFAVGADTQETHTYYDEHGNPYELRCAVQKLEPKHIGNYDFAIVGAGHAPLIDGFIERARRAVTSDVQQPSASALRSVLEMALDAFYRNEVAICQDQDKDFKLFIPYFCPQTKEYGVWVSERTVLRDAKTDRPELNGIEYELYEASATKLFRADMSLAQAVLASIDVLTIGEETSNYIKGPFHVAVVRENGIWMETADYIRMMSERLREYECGINRLFLACADTEISPQRFAEELEKFGVEAALLHKRHLDAAIQRMLDVGLNKIITPYAQIPLGTVIRTFPDGGFEAQFDVDARRIMTDIVRAQHDSVPEPLQGQAKEPEKQEPER